MDRYVSNIIAANILKLGYQQYRVWPTQLASKIQQPQEALNNVKNSDLP